MNFRRRRIPDRAGAGKNTLFHWRGLGSGGHLGQPELEIQMNKRACDRIGVAGSPAEA